MSTHSNIGIENSDGSVSYVYCHRDGYIMGVGRAVAGMDRKQAQDVINAGDMSCVGEPYTARGESIQDVRHRTRATMDDFIKDAFDRGAAHFVYVITRRGTWKYCTYGDRVLHPLKSAVKAAEKSEQARRGIGPVI